MFNKILNYLNDEKNIYKVFFFIVIFLSVVKLPTLFTADIQPWDEGMYATRVLSIHTNGDFLDQSEHSVDKFYSGSHPPLLIWIGYFCSLAFGLNSVTLKLIPFVFSLLSIFLLILIGRNLFNPISGITAALVFSSNIIFNVFSKRFQFDIPYTFFILLSFYLFLLYLDKKKFIYNVLGGIVFGLCLMVKILVGFYIPIIIFLFYILLRKKTGYRFFDLVIFTSIGIIIALPWHLYMLLQHGKEFIDYFFKFHIYDRAFIGVEHNTKGSGYLYHINYLLSIIPYSILIFISLVKDFLRIKEIDYKKIFLIIWFLTGLAIITLFKTKLEVYILLILAPGSLLLGDYLFRINEVNSKEKLIAILLTTLNIIWTISFAFRNDTNYKSFILNNILVVILTLVFSFVIIFFSIKLISSKISVGKFYYVFIYVFYFAINIYFLINVPNWEYDIEIKDMQSCIEKSGKKNIIYVGTNYRANPQFSFYFKGLDLGWKNDKYTYELLDIKNGINDIKNKLNSVPVNEYNIIVEKGNINRSEYQNSKFFIPQNFRLIYQTKGYELYQK
ncbi:MAG: glycosyltransferase family 39 protein [Ignavibacteriae bacterium]|nr:glycosyltransferase family 39 protein [Ignavibacteriota bacterium]